MAVGKVKWFNDEKGWGFIKQDEGPDVFVHYSQINGDGRRRLYEDETVEFEIKEGPKGLQAINVTRLNGGGGGVAAYSLPSSHSDPAPAPEPRGGRRRFVAPLSASGRLDGQGLTGFASASQRLVHQRLPWR
jgi:cold shock protein